MVIGIFSLVAIILGEGRLFSSLSHGGFNHLISNTVVFLPLSWLVLLKGVRGYIFVWICVQVVQIFEALFWPAASHGMSGLIDGLFGYLVIVGILEKNFLSILFRMAIIYLYGYLFSSLLPWNVPSDMSRIVHFSRFIGGFMAAFAVYRE